LESSFIAAENPTCRSCIISLNCKYTELY